MQLELENMVLLYVVCIKSLKWIQMAKFLLKKCEESVTDVRKGKAKEKRFPT